MAATIPQVRAALAAQLAGVAAASTPPLRVSAGWTGQINPPAAVVRRVTTDYAVGNPHTGQALSRFVVGVYVSSSDVSAQDVIDQFLARDGTTSIVAAIKADITLGGVVQRAIPSTVEEETIVTIGGAEYLAVNIPVDVVH